MGVWRLVLMEQTTSKCEESDSVVHGVRVTFISKIRYVVELKYLIAESGLLF